MKLSCASILGDSGVCPSAPTNRRYFKYALAVPVRGGGGGAGRLAAWFKYNNPPAPASSTTPITMATGGTEIFVCGVRPGAGASVLFTANRHFSYLQSR